MESSFDMGSLENLATPKVEVTSVTVSVLAQPDNIRLLTSELVLNYKALANSRGGDFDVSELQMFCFFLTAMYYRVEYVASHSHSYKNYVQYNEHPHTLGVLLANIGKAFDDQTGIDLIPSLSISTPIDESTNSDGDVVVDKTLKDYLLNEEEYLNVSRKVKALRILGISTGRELPNDKKGDFLTMSFACIEGATKREDNRAHPTQAIIAMISGINLAQSIATPRVTYISPDRVNTLIRAAASYELPKGT